MKKMTALFSLMAMPLVSCGDNQASVDQAATNLQETADNAATKIERVASEIPNSAQANVLVDQSVDLTNAAQNVENATDETGRK